LLVDCGLARTRADAFQRWLGPLAGWVVPKLLLPVEEAIALVRDAEGVASLAHPSPVWSDSELGALAEMGLVGLEVEYPWGRRSQALRLRDAATRLHLAVTGGSDCHGPDPAHRRIGSHGITPEELSALRGRRGRTVSSAP
jgi:predicted metal-dependent phosphoesterase TrpH